MDKFLITARCSFGLESMLKKEILRLGYEIAGSAEGFVSVMGDMNDVYRLNLNLRTATRVLIELAEFEARSFDELFDNVNAIDFSAFLPKNARFGVEKITSVKSELFSKSDCQRIIKKAAVESMKRSYKTDKIPESGSNYPIYAYIRNNIAKICLNTSGESLHKRGYRTSQGKAPLKEDLAAGLVLLSGYYGKEPLCDIMCGSGTILIEGAMIASNTPPGLNRHFGFEQWDMYNKRAFEEVKEEGISKIRPVQNQILGNDIDGNVLKKARENAKRAGVENMVHFQKMDMRDFSSKKKGGIIITNPPYAERIGERKQTEKLYKDMRKVYESLDDWRMYVLCANEDFTRCYGKKADKNRKLFNGNMMSYVYMYGVNNRR
ncbi:MAG: class I SAM-dependent RNA methyltransferase [Anaerofustis stercorihominis]|nr:class I SAM-dependent RNA methyltransferase [Anaerofustis stercorihominis]